MPAGFPYYIVERAEPVEKDDWLKAGHSVEFFSDIQLCAIAVGHAETSIVSAARECLPTVRFLFAIVRWSRPGEGLRTPVVNAWRTDLLVNASLPGQWV